MVTSLGELERRHSSQPWSPADATTWLNELASEETLDLAITMHAQDRLGERGLIVGDLLYLLRRGFVYDPPEQAIRAEFWKYVVEGSTPNSESRTVRTVAIPDCVRKQIKIVTIMWKDER